MKRSPWMVLAIVLAVGGAWISWIRYVNTRTTQLQVQVAGDLERVAFYRVAAPDAAVAEIVTHGQATESLVVLRTASRESFFMQAAPAQYYFVAEQGGQRYQSPVICCETGFADRREGLIIQGLQQWERTGP